MDPEIKIKALPIDEQRCRFTVDRPLLPGRAAYFGDAGRAAGSPLAEALFALPDVASVTVAGDVVTVTRGGYGEWPDLARKVGMAIRAQLQRGAPPISEAALEGLPGEDEIGARVQRLRERESHPA